MKRKALIAQSGGPSPVINSSLQVGLQHVHELAAAPLIGDADPEIPREGGLQRFARLDIRFMAKKCPEYIPIRLRAGA